MLQGPHHEPKKLMTTGLPRSAARVKVAPPVVVALKLLGVDALSRAVEYPQAAMMTTAATAMIVTSRLLPTVDLTRSLLTHVSATYVSASLVSRFIDTTHRHPVGDRGRCEPAQA
jgi:hypothetical protein